MKRNGYVLVPVLLLAAASAPAEEDARTAQPAQYREIEPQELARTPPPSGTLISVTGKYKERINEELTLFDCDVPFVVTGESALRLVQDLTTRRDNVVLLGRVAQARNLQTIVEVDDIRRAPTDLQRFENEWRRLNKDGRADMAASLEVAKAVWKHHERFGDDSLAPMARRILEETYDRFVAVESSQAREAVSFVERVHRVVQDRSITLSFLLQAGNRFPDDPEMRRLLRTFECRHYRGRWVTHEQFKTSEGLVNHDGTWMSAARRDFLVALEKFRATKKSDLLLIRRRTDREYELMGAAGRVETGMTRREVQAALGFAEEVRRTMLEGSEFDQWCYDDEFYYFYDGVLVQQGQRQEDGRDG